MSKNIYKQATRLNLLFPTSIGELTISQMWDLPLTGEEGSASLDGTAMTVHRRLEAVSTQSFVNTKPHPDHNLLELRLDILKDMIETKQEEGIARLQEADRKNKQRALAEAISRKELSQYDDMSIEDLEKELESL